MQRAAPAAPFRTVRRPRPRPKRPTGPKRPTRPKAAPPQPTRRSNLAGHNFAAFIQQAADLFENLPVPVLFLGAALLQRRQNHAQAGFVANRLEDSLMGSPSREGGREIARSTQSPLPACNQGIRNEASKRIRTSVGPSDFNWTGEGPGEPSST